MRKNDQHYFFSTILKRLLLEKAGILKAQAAVIVLHTMRKCLPRFARLPISRALERLNRARLI
jgi:hypothetical protein